MLAVILLLMVSCAWAQPEWYPVWSSHHRLLNVNVCVRGDTADIVCAADSSPFYAAFNLSQRQLIEAHQLSSIIGWEWPHNEITDLAAVSNTKWACLNAGNNSNGGYGTFTYRIGLLGSSDESWNDIIPVAEANYHNFPNNFSGGWLEAHSLRVRNGRVAVAYIFASVGLFDVQYNVEYREYDSDSLNETVSASTGIYAFWNEPFNRAIAVPIGADSVVIYSDFGFDGDQTLYIGPLDGFIEQVNYRNLVCGNSRHLRTLEVTNGNRIIAGFMDNSLNEIIVNGNEASCTPFAQLPANWSPEWAFHPDFGFAAVNVNAGYLTIARVDTNGQEVQPPGVIYVVTEENDIVAADIAITDSGQVVCVWSEHHDWDQGAHILKIAWVDWDTYLDVPMQQPETPVDFELTAFPNPFNANVAIRFALPSAGEVALRVFDLQGRLVATLLDERVSAGSHTVNWSPENLASGVYFAQLTTSLSVRNTKLLYLK